MIDTLRSEWIKVRTTRTTFVLVLCALGLQVLVVGLTAVFVEVDPLRTMDLVTAATATSIVVGLLFGVVGTLVITSEHAHGTIRPTFAATPRRERVYAAKWIVVTLASLAGGAAVVWGSFAMGWAIVTTRGGDVDLGSEPGNLRALVGAVLLIGVLAWLGLAVGMLTRSSPLSIVLLALWPLIVENIIGGVLFVAGLEGLVRWLPYSAGLMMAMPDIPEDTLGPWGGGAWFASITVVLLVAGVLVSRRRDA